MRDAWGKPNWTSVKHCRIFLISSHQIFSSAYFYQGDSGRRDQQLLLLYFPPKSSHWQPSLGVVHWDGTSKPRKMTFHLFLVCKSNAHIPYALALFSCVPNLMLQQITFPNLPYVVNSTLNHCTTEHHMSLDYFIFSWADYCNFSCLDSTHSSSLFYSIHFFPSTFPSLNFTFLAWLTRANFPSVN